MRAGRVGEEVFAEADDHQAVGADAEVFHQEPPGFDRAPLGQVLVVGLGALGVGVAGNQEPGIGKLRRLQRAAEVRQQGLGLRRQRGAVELVEHREIDRVVVVERHLAPGPAGLGDFHLDDLVDVGRIVARLRQGRERALDPVGPLRVGRLLGKGRGGRRDRDQRDGPEKSPGCGQCGSECRVTESYHDQVLVAVAVVEF